MDIEPASPDANEGLLLRLAQVDDPQALLKGIFEHSPIALQVYRADGHSLLVNRAFLDLFGGGPPPEYNVFNDSVLEKAGFVAMIRRAFAGETIFVGAHWYDPREMENMEVKVGRRRGLEVTLFPLRDASGEIQFIGQCTKDVTAELELRTTLETLRLTDCSLEQKVTELQQEIANREKAESHIRHLAYHDTLTGLPNRLFLKERLDEMLSAHDGPGSLAVLFVDLDRFKVVNDTAGHVEGDRMLSNVAQRLADVSGKDDIVGRIGGDEFVVLLPNLSDPSEAAVAAQRVVKSLHEPQRLGSHEFNITASVGITTFPGDDRDAETLIRHADIAMYEAKSLGRDGYQFYTPEMNQSILERLELENDLRHALERGELEVYYQPLNSAGDRRLVGAEALLRWNHPDRGLVMPAKFIPIAEETGLIVSIGEWMMRTACAQVQAWQKEGWSDFRLAVNLSARQFQQVGLCETIVTILRETGLRAESLQVEVTESTIIVNLDYAVAVLNQLRALGVEVAIDDFGTGHSGLSYLNQLPIDVLKIDRSFVTNILANDREAEIVATIIGLAHNLGLKVVAEGVETEGQLAFLQAHDCDKVQGYLFSEPVPAAVFAVLRHGEPGALAA